MTTNLRDQICMAVAALNEKEDAIESQLLPLLRQAQKEPSRVTTGGISPLLVACDRGNVECLKVLVQFDRSIVGHPLEASPESEGANTPVHHAAMAGCSQAWHVFAAFDDNCNAASLASVTNAHGDTPLQMAVIEGHLEFLQEWYNVMNNDDNGARQKILQIRNQEGGSCATLACCHGHVEILEFLLNVCRVFVSSEEASVCQTAVDRIDQSIKAITDPQVLQVVQKRQKRVHECLDQLKAAVNNQAEAAAQELLLLEEVKASSRLSPLVASNNGKPPKKYKKKRKGKGKGNNQESWTLKKKIVKGGKGVGKEL